MASADRELSEAEIERYARHIVLQEVGGVGQAKLLASKALVVGAGGLGSPLVLYLAAAGIGTIGVVDDDTVSLSNLQRQILHTTARVGQPKVASAVEAVRAIDPNIRIVPHRLRVDANNVRGLIDQYDIVADGSDNFETRFLLNDACYFARKTLVSGAALRFDGQVATYKPYLGHPHPCYRCIFREPPPPDIAPTCATGGVLGALVGTVGALQATEVVKELLGVGDSLSGFLLIYDGLATRFRKITVKPDADCPLCGKAPSIRDLSIHAAA
jgi:molybdopterin-synthase adenylyltransferase